LEWWKGEEEEAEAQSITHKQMPKMRRLKTKKNEKERVKGQFDLVNKDDAIEKILGNTFQVRLHGRRRVTGLTNCTISGFYCFVTNHADLAVGGIEAIDIFGEDGKLIACSSRVAEVIPLKGRDIVRIKFNTSDVRSFKSLRNRLRSRNDDLPKATAARIWKDVKPATNKVLIRMTEGGFIRKCRSDLTITYDYVEGGSSELDVTEYIRVPDCRGLSGDCGKPYILVSHETQDFLGIHCASIGKDAIIAPIYQEDLPVDGQCQWRQPILEVIHSDYNRQTIIPGLHNEGLIDGARIPHMPTKDEFEQSKIFEAMNEDGAVNVAPAVITFIEVNGVILDPRENAYKKFAKRRWVEDWSLIKEADEKPSRAYKGFGKPRRPVNELTTQQAIFGIPGEIESYPRDTSSTYEYQIHGKKRTDLWDPDTQYIDPELIKDVDDIYQAASEGKELVSYATGCIKSELRSLDRVYAANSRLFCIFSLAMCIFLKRMCGDLMAELKTHLGDVGSSVGVNPFSFDWMELFHYLSEVDGPMGGGDAGGWDMNCKCSFSLWLEYYLCDCYNIARNVKDPAYLRIRSATRVAIAFILIVGRRAFRVLGMVSSGNFLTSFENSFFNHCVHRLIWRQIRPDRSWKWSQHMRLRVYGDDNIWRVSKEASSFWNMLEIARCFKTYFGMNYTTPGKDEVTKPFLSLDEFVFLSRRFRFVRHHGHVVMILAPLEKDSIYGMLAWIRTSAIATAEEQLQVNVKTACMEMSQYGREEYENFVMKMRAWAQKSNFQCKLDDYDTWESKILSSYHVTSTTMSENWDSVDGMEQCLANVAISATD